MRLFALFLAGASLFGCARDRQNVDIASREAELEPSQNLMVVVRDDEEFGRAYRLIAVSYSLDGETIYTREAARNGELVDAARVYRGNVAPGPHLLEVTLTYQPNDSRILRDSPIRSGTNLGIQSERRFVVLPDTPTIVEADVNRATVAFLINYPEAIATAPTR